jgi:hypothetical protein
MRMLLIVGKMPLGILTERKPITWDEIEYSIQSDTLCLSPSPIPAPKIKITKPADTDVIVAEVEIK